MAEFNILAGNPDYTSKELSARPLYPRPYFFRLIGRDVWTRTTRKRAPSGSNVVGCRCSRRARCRLPLSKIQFPVGA
jgi:hypothetical protein